MVTYAPGKGMPDLVKVKRMAMKGELNAMIGEHIKAHKELESWFELYRKDPEAKLPWLMECMADLIEPMEGSLKKHTKHELAEYRDYMEGRMKEELEMYEMAMAELNSRISDADKVLRCWLFCINATLFCIHVAIWNKCFYHML